METSGSEPCYYPQKWSEDKLVQYSHNCYAYALNDLFRIPRTGGKPQPGKYGTGSSADKINCKTIHELILDDNPGGIVIPVKKERLMKACKPGFYKMFLMVNDAGEDYHFARQDSSGFWSHKPGSGKVSNKDASGKKIQIPHLSDWNYQKKDAFGINYNVMCGYYCVSSSKLTRSGGYSKNTRVDYRSHVPRTDVYKLNPQTISFILQKIRKSNAGKHSVLKVLDKVDPVTVKRTALRNIAKKLLSLKPSNAAAVKCLLSI